ncbi:MAG: prepilin peptidase [Candidatus Odinarchaeota archaeon]
MEIVNLFLIGLFLSIFFLISSYFDIKHRIVPNQLFKLAFWCTFILNTIECFQNYNYFFIIIYNKFFFF